MSVVRLKRPGDTEPVEVHVRQTSHNECAHIEVLLEQQRWELQAECDSTGAGWIRKNGAVLPFYAIRRENEMQVWLRGRVYTFSLHRPSAQRTEATLTDNAQENLTAPMPGTVLQVNVKAGDSFEAQQSLVVLESMKMEMTLSVPHVGVIEKIHCAVGDRVQMGDVLATLGEVSDA